MVTEPWTPEEEEVLRQMAGKNPARVIADRLGRSINNVLWRARKLGISFVNPEKSWLPEHELFLRQKIAEESIAAIALALGRSEAAIRVRCNILGIPRRKTAFPWTPFEDDYIRRRWGITPPAILAAELRRTVGAITTRASIIGCTDPLIPFSPAEDQVIRERWGEQSSHQIGREIGRTKTQVAHRARTLGMPGRSGSWKERRELISKLFAEGKSDDEIGKVVGLSGRQVSGIRRETLNLNRDHDEIVAWSQEKARKTFTDRYGCDGIGKLTQIRFGDFAERHGWPREIGVLGVRGVQLLNILAVSGMPLTLRQLQLRVRPEKPIDGNITTSLGKLAKMDLVLRIPNLFRTNGHPVSGYTLGPKAIAIIENRLQQEG